jgi:hypothetical protein
VNDDSVSALSIISSISPLLAIRQRYVIVRLPCSQDVCYAGTECSRLIPATICKRRVVGSRRREMPLIVSSIETGSMSAVFELAKVGYSLFPPCVLGLFCE